MPLDKPTHRFQYLLKNPRLKRAFFDVVRISPSRLLWSVSAVGGKYWSQVERRALLKNVLNQIPDDVEINIFNWIPGRVSLDVELLSTEKSLNTKADLIREVDGVGSFRIMAVSGLVPGFDSFHKHPALSAHITGPPQEVKLDSTLHTFLDAKGYTDLLCTVNLDDPSKGFSMVQMAQLTQSASFQSPHSEEWRCRLSCVPIGTRVVLVRQSSSQGVIGLGKTAGEPTVDASGIRRVEVDWQWAAMTPPTGLNAQSLLTDFGNHAWSNQQSGIRLASWVGEKIERRVKALTRTAPLEDVVAAYNASPTAARFFKTQGRSKKYRQIRNPDWSARIHFEFLTTGSVVRPELHLEGKYTAKYRPILQDIVQALQGNPVSRVEIDPKWYKAGRVILHVSPTATAESIAAEMEELIAVGQPLIQKALSSDSSPPVPEPDDVVRIRRFLEHKPQLILYGPPGTGKTRLARRVAFSLLGGAPRDIDDEKKVEEVLQDARYRLIVFHPAYEYDQFIGGLSVKSTDQGHLHYIEKPGVFTELCKQAGEDDRPYILVIDELNRGNLPKLLGELIYALEYRGSAVTLSFDGQTYTVPENLHIIGTMNTADRSVGALDAAIRRRFGFHRIGPDPSVVKLTRLRKLMKLINKRLEKLAREMPELSDLQVGHSYFLGCADEAAFDLRWALEVLPLLEEYVQLTGHSALQELCVADWRKLLPETPADDAETADGA